MGRASQSGRKRKTHFEKVARAWCEVSTSVSERGQMEGCAPAVEDLGGDRKRPRSCLHAGEYVPYCEDRASEAHPRRPLVPDTAQEHPRGAPTTEGIPPPMMPQLALGALVLLSLFAVLAGVYLYSADQGRRDRAWRLLRLLLPRR